MFDLIAYTNCSHSPTVEDAWRDPDHEQSEGYRDLDFWTDLASRLEDGGFDALFFADAYNVADRYRGDVDPTIRRGEQVPENDPIPLLSALAATTETLGLVATASTSFYPPYLLAKKFSTVDDLSNGRLGWNIVTSSGSLEFENVVGEYVPHDERYDRAAEHVAACRRLWEDSWDDGTVREDADAGVYADPDRVSFVDYEGEYVEVPGPHMCAPTPQRTPVLFQAGQSDRGRAFGVRHAEALFSFHLSLDGFADYAADIAERAAAIDRPASSYDLYPAITPYVAPTATEARALHDRVLDLIEPETGLVRLSNHLNHDYGQYDLDAPLREVNVEGIRGALSVFLDDDREWTVRDAAVRYARYPTAELVGTPDAVADELERWGEAGADGFVIMAPLVPRTFDDVATHLVPELRRRGLLTESTPTARTLRERLLGTDAPPARRGP